jgi:hypothetical protein
LRGACYASRMTYPTLDQRRRRRLDQMKTAVADLRLDLAAYQERHRGRFHVFGSAQRDQLRFDSDIDILLDFPPDEELAAWLFAEKACWCRRLTPDLHLKAWSAPEFLKRIGAA